MDIWQKLYEAARAEYRPTEVSPFIYAHHVVCALEAQDGASTPDSASKPARA